MEILTKPLLGNVKSPLPVGVRRSKTPLLKFPIIWTGGLPHLSGLPHLPAILVTLSWDTPCCTQKPLGAGEQKIPLLSRLIWRGDEYCSPRHMKLGHPVLYPYSDKKLCSLLPPVLFFCFWHATTTTTTTKTKTKTKVYFHDHRGIIVLQKVLV